MSSSSANICSICICSLDDSPLAAIPCGHVFHRSCLNQSLNVRAQCPNCSKAVPFSPHSLHPIFLSSEDCLLQDAVATLLKAQLDALSLELKRTQEALAVANKERIPIYDLGRLDGSKREYYRQEALRFSKTLHVKMIEIRVVTPSRTLEYISVPETASVAILVGCIQIRLKTRVTTLNLLGDRGRIRAEVGKMGAARLSDLGLSNGSIVQACP